MFEPFVVIVAPTIPWSLTTYAATPRDHTWILSTIVMRDRNEAASYW